MRIGINALFLIPGGVGGTETYIRNLLESLARIDEKNEYVLFTNRENSGTFGIAQSNFREVLCPISASFRPARILWEQFALPFQVKKSGIDVLHSPGYTAPAMVSCPSIVTICDMNYAYYPEDWAKLSLLFLKILVPLAARKSDKIVALSQNSKRDIVKILEVPEDKVRVIYLSGNEICYSVAHDETINQRTQELGERYGIRGEFILTVAASHPHKNLERLIEAYGILRERKLVKHQLVLVGMKGRANHRLTDLVAELSLQEAVIFTGWVPDEHMPLLYSAADLFVFSSLFEGFGIPVLEAMACGTPVVSSNATSLPEVVGDAGVLVDPYDIEGMAEAMYEVLSNDALRDALVTKGLDRVKMFSWERTARETLAVYEELYGRKRTMGRKR